MNIAPASGVTPHAALKQLALLKSADVTTDDHFWQDHTGERVPLAGGSWDYGSRAGLFSLGLDHARSDSGRIVGARVAYAEI